MKKFIAILLSMLLLFTLAGCGDKESAPVDEKGSGSQSEPESDSTSEATGKDKVEIDGDTVVHTSDDGLGNTTITKYKYKDGALQEVEHRIDCADTSAAKALYEAMKNGELKATADASYSEVNRDGKAIICKLNDYSMSAFTNLSKEDMAAVLSGEPLSSVPSEITE